VSDVTIRFAICHFLSVVRWKRLSKHFQDIRPQHTFATEQTKALTNIPTNTTDRNTSCRRL